MIETFRTSIVPDSVVRGIIEVPSSGMTDDISPISWFLKHAQLPERIRNPEQSHCGVEIISSLEHLQHCVVLFSHGWAWINWWLATEWLSILKPCVYIDMMQFSDLVEVIPKSSPHITQKMCRKRTLKINVFWSINLEFWS